MTPEPSQLEIVFCSGFSADFSRLWLSELPMLRSTSSKRLPSMIPLAKAVVIDLPKACADLLRLWVSVLRERRPPTSNEEE